MIELKDFAYEWLDFIKSKISEETINRYKLDIELRILPNLGNYKLKDFNVYIMDKFKKDLDNEKKFSSSNKYKDRINKPKTDKLLSNKSKNEVFKLLRRMLDKAVIWGKMRYNSAQKVEKPKSEKSIRTITIQKVVVEQIKLYRKWYNKNKKVINIQDLGMLFYSENGN